MTIQYQLAYDDFLEATLAQAQEAAKRRSGRARLVGFGAFAAAWIIGSLMVPLFRQSTTNPNGPWTDYLNLFMPMLALAVIYLPIVSFAQGFRRKQAVANLAFLIFFVMGIGLFVLLMMLARSMPSAVPGATRTLDEIDWLAVLFPHFSWLILTVAFALFTVRVRRAQLRKRWHDQQQLHRPYTVEISVNGITFSTSVSRLDYRWDAIPRLSETSRLFLFYVNNLAVHIVPKRAFANDEEREALRNMARNLIAAQRQGFEVVAAAENTVEKAKW